MIKQITIITIQIQATIKSYIHEQGNESLKFCLQGSNLLIILHIKKLS